MEIVFLLIALAVCCAVNRWQAASPPTVIRACSQWAGCTVQSCQNSNIVLSICADSFMGICYLLSLYLGCFAYPDEPAICFHVVAVVLGSYAVQSARPSGTSHGDQVAAVWFIRP